MDASDLQPPKLLQNKGKPSCSFSAGSTKHENYSKDPGAKGSRIQWEGLEVKTLELSNSGFLESYFRIKLTLFCL